MWVYEKWNCKCINCIIRKKFTFKRKYCCYTLLSSSLDLRREFDETAFGMLWVGVVVGFKHCAKLTISHWTFASAWIILNRAFWFSVMRRRMKSTSSIILLFSLWFACKCCKRTSRSFWDLWMASSCGRDKAVETGAGAIDGRRAPRDTVFRLLHAVYAPIMKSKINITRKYYYNISKNDAPKLVCNTIDDQTRRRPWVVINSIFLSIEYFKSKID